MVELLKLERLSSRTLSQVLDPKELARHGNIIAALEKVDEVEPPAEQTASVPWERLSPRELDEYRAAREVLRTAPGDLNAGYTLARLRARAFELDTAKKLIITTEGTTT
jgi:hypothetical protein